MIRSLAMVVLSLLVSFGLVEAVMRVFDLYARVAGEYNPGLDREFHHNYGPLESFIRYPSLLDEFPPVLNEINSIGIRGPEVGKTAVDLLVLGDSFIQAEEIDWEKTLGCVLQRGLVQAGLDITVVSHGMSSWSPLLEWNWYLKIGRSLAPRVVLLFVVWNDFVAASEYVSSDEGYLGEVVMTDQGRPDYFLVPASNDSWYDHLDTVRIVQLALHRLEALRALRVMRDTHSQAVCEWSVAPLEEATKQAAQQSPIGGALTEPEIQQLLSLAEPEFSAQLAALHAPPHIRGFWNMLRPLELWPREQLEQLEASATIIERFAQDVAEDGGELILVYVPSPWQVGPFETQVGRRSYGIADGAVVPVSSGLQEWLTLLAGRLDLELLDPTEGMRSYSEAGHEDLLYLRYDGHWSESGHAWMAGFFAEWYRRRAW